MALGLIEPAKQRNSLISYIKRTKYVFAKERILFQVINMCGKHPVSSDGGTWYPKPCKFLNYIITFIPLEKKNN